MLLLKGGFSMLNDVNYFCFVELEEELFLGSEAVGA